jgi:hypothetical protein
VHKKLTAEQRLANYWRKKTGLEWSDFDIFDQGKKPPKGTGARGQSVLLDKSATWEEVNREIGWLILRGFPLTYEEYHVATACHYLRGEEPYEVFFKKRWYESESHRGYGSNLREVLGV